MEWRLLGVVACSTFAALSVADACEDGVPVDSAEFVSVGGIDQWVTIRGADCHNPPMLFLHGGPGDALSPFSGRLLADWEHHFTLIQWDQPGAGRTFSNTGPEIASELSIDRIVLDGIDVAEFVLDKLGHEKLILVGTSWGSIIGTRMVRNRPDLFNAYVGISQVVSMKRAVPIGYRDAIGHFERAGNEAAVTELEDLGPPPWDSVGELAVLFRSIRAIRGQSAPNLIGLTDPEFTPAEFQSWLAADEFSQLHFFGAALDGELMNLDLLEESVDLSVPVYVFQGSDDLITPQILAEQYVNALDASEKGLFRIQGAGHELLFEASDELLKELVTRFGVE